MRKILMATMALALVLPLAVSAQPGPGPDCPDGPRFMGRGDGPHGEGRGRPVTHHLLRMADDIGLTEDQQEQLKQLVFEFRTAQIDRKAELEKARLRLRTLKMDEDASVDEVNRAIDEVAALRAVGQKARYAHRKQVHEILTDEQIEKIKELRRERREERREGRPGFRGHGRRGTGGFGG
jgi:Spy/CpxP family protein refolding chaperone